MEDGIIGAAEMLRQITEGLQTVWIWGALPGLFILYAVVGALVLRVSGSGVAAAEVRTFRRRSAGSYLFRCMRRFGRAASGLTIFLVVCPLFLLINLEHKDFVLSLTGSTDSLCSMVIGLTTIVLTVSVVIILLRKSYYLVFDITDVLKSYHFTEWTGMLLSSCFFTCVCTLLLLYLRDETFWYRAVLLLLEWSLLGNLAAAGGSFWIIYRVLFSDQKTELRILDRLYRIFIGEEKPDNAQGGQAAGWEIRGVRTNVEYLSAQYVAAARTVPIHRVRRFVCLENEARREWWRRQMERVAGWFLALALIGGCCSLAVIAAVLRGEGAGLALLNCMMMAGLILLYLAGRRTRSAGMDRLFAGSAVCLMGMGQRKDTVILPQLPKKANRYDRFYRRMNSLTAFFVLTLQQGAGQEMVEQALDVVLDWMSDVKEWHTCFYLPVFSIGYYAYGKGMELPALRACCRAVLEEGQQGDVRGRNARSRNAREQDTRKQDDREQNSRDRDESRPPVERLSRVEFDEMLRSHLTALAQEVPAADGNAGRGETEEEQLIADYLNWLHDPGRVTSS